MMQLRGEPLQDFVYQQIEQMAGPDAQRALWAKIKQIADPQERTEWENLIIRYCAGQTDAALLLGFQMARDPGAWLFLPTAEE